MRKLSRRPLTAAVALVLLGTSSVATAITNDEVNSGVQFSFSNPGARSLGLGGAFTGLADDATAAYANPAGLTILRTQELAAEVRYTSFDTPYTKGGTVGFFPYDNSGVIDSTSSSSVFQPSYASWVIPFERMTFAMYYQRLADFETSFKTNGLTIDLGGGSTDRVFPASTDLDFSVQNIGAALGLKLSDNFSVGLSVAYSDFELNSKTVRTEGNNQQLQSGDDSDWVYGLGALWRISDQWNLGLAYRRGGEFSYNAVNQSPPGTTVVSQRPSFDVPHVLSAGVAFRPAEAWLLTLDVNRVYYSELTDNNSPDLFSTGATVPTPLQVDDGTEVRLGVEYVFLNMERPLFLRGGVWRDPDHRIRNDEFDDCNGDGFGNCVDATLFIPGDDEWHYSIGIGWAFQKFQIDAAMDFSDLVDTYSVSGVLRF